MDKKIKTIFSLLIILIGLSMIGGCENRMQKQRAAHGILDLSQWNFEEQGPVRLDGEWEFHWKQLYRPEAFKVDKEEFTNKDYVRVPGTWKDYNIDKKDNSGYGYATYRMQIILPVQEKVYAIRVSSIATSHKIWINGEQISMNGQIGIDQKSAVPNVTPNIIHFSSKKGTVELIIQVSNFVHRKGGIWQSLMIGESDQIRKMHDRNVFFDISLFGSILVMAFYHLSLYALRKKDPSTLYFSTFCFLIALRILLVGEKFLQLLIPQLPQEVAFKLEYLTFYLGMMIFYMSIHVLFPKEMSEVIYKGTVSMCMIYSAIVLMTSSRIYTYMLTSFQMASIMFCIYLLYVISLAVLRRRDGARIILIGTIIFVIAVINDIFYYNGIIATGNMTPIGLFIFIFSQSFILSARFSRAFTTIEEMSERLLAMDRIKDEFLANVTHEIVTPLSGMIGIAESMNDGVAGSLNVEQTRNLFLIISSGRRLTALVNDILDFSRLKNQDIQLKKSDVCLKEIVGLVLELCRPLADDKKIVLKNNIPDNFGRIQADVNRLQQILHNLIGNAIKFTQVGTITLSAVQRERFIEITVADTGIGIAPEEHEKIFNAFEQIDKGTASKFGGTGLGLSITKTLIELHGGTICVDSEEGKGAKFIFTLPIENKKLESIHLDMLKRNNLWSNSSEDAYKFRNLDATCKHTTEQKGVKNKNNKEDEFKVLIVDDEYVNRQVMINQLLLKKYIVITALSGKEAIKIMKENIDIDMVILDIMMPDMNGYEVCRILRQDYSMLELPILMLTAKNQEKDIIMAFDAGANDYLTKPFNKKEMLARVDTLLNIKKLMVQMLEAKTQFLQAQIRPHFLYNTLNTIMAFCRTDPEKAWQLLDELSNYLRGKFSFRDTSRYIPLEKELDFVHSYLTIEKARFGERLKIEYDIRTDTSMLVPPLILQPIVENAVRHGIYPIKKGGTVTISVQNQNGTVVIQIADDGVGMTQQQIEDLFQGQKKDQGIGLLNVHTRLKTNYGQGLKIQSEPGRGTRITIHMPYRETAAQTS
ncbi:MAG: ATP-binding protein [Thermotaleaceae bacterium]